VASIVDSYQITYFDPWPDWWLDLFGQQLLPVHSVKECMLANSAPTFGATAQSLAGILCHQLSIKVQVDQ
jgi:hypothetical protein